MNIPKVVFREMTFDENLEIIKWAYYENNASSSLDVRGYLFSLIPELEFDTKGLTSKEIEQKVESIFKSAYESIKEELALSVKNYNEYWSKINDAYMQTLSKYLNVRWPDNIKIIDASVGWVPVSPRNLDKKSFSLIKGLEAKDVINIAAHEILHFFWFLKWEELFPNMPKEEYEAPNLAWQYSEMVTEPILNTKEFQDILNVLEKTSYNFYELKKGDKCLMEDLKVIFSTDKSIEEKILAGFEYVKNF